MRIIESYENIAGLRAEGRHPAALLDQVERRLTDVIRAFKEVDADWSAEEYGGFVLVEEGDDVRDFRSVGLNPENQGLIGAVWEACFRHPEAAAYEIIVLYGGDTGWTFFVPDAAWVGAALRGKLAAEATAFVWYDPVEIPSTPF